MRVILKTILFLIFKKWSFMLYIHHCISQVKTMSYQYLAFVMLLLAATSLAVRGSGSDVGMGEF